MSIYTVYLLSPIKTWNNVEAKNKAEAIGKCYADPQIDLNKKPFHYSNGPHSFFAVEIEEEE